MTLTEITAAISSLKAGIQILKGLNNLSSTIELNNAVSDLQSIIIDVQSNLLELQEKYSSLLNQKNELEEKLKTVNDWNLIKNDFTCEEISEGLIVYVNTKDSIKTYYCPNCFQKNQISILQRRAPRSGIFDCPNCKNNFKTYDELPNI